MEVTIVKVISVRSPLALSNDLPFSAAHEGALRRLSCLLHHQICQLRLASSLHYYFLNVWPLNTFDGEFVAFARPESLNRLCRHIQNLETQ